MRRFCFLLMVFALGTGCSRLPVRGEPPLLPMTGVELRERIASSDARILLLHVWSTWCLPCVDEFPGIVRLEREFRNGPVTFLVVSADFPDRADEVREFLREQKVSFPTYIKAGGDREFIRGISADWTGTLPATYFYDREGQVLAGWEGDAPYERYRETLGRLLGRELGEKEES